MTEYDELQTPRHHHPHALEHLDGTGAHVEQQHVHDVSEQRLQLERMRYRAQLDQQHRHSDMSSYARDSDDIHSIVRAYEPSLKERLRAALEGRTGLYLEMTNFAFSVLIFAVYVAELYDDDLQYSTAQRIVEVLVTSFFIFDLMLHLFVAPSPWRYLLSVHGAIDLLTIIPSIIVFLVPATRSQLFFVLRVLRIFRALRVLRLKQFLRFKKSKFDYELAVFMLSSVAVILCAAGMFHALEESYYTSANATLRFHEALYFVLVTTATIGYGDFAPHTAMGQLFVVVLIVGIFTVVPREVSKLNELAKQTHAYDKDYCATTHASGHVVVASDALSTDAALDFLHEFYHTSRGAILLDVVFLSSAPPSPALARLLATDRFRWRARYLRGSIAHSVDQRRVQLDSATAVFLLAANRSPQYHNSANATAAQDAATILHTLAVRNFADSHGLCVDLYAQLLSHHEQHAAAARYLGAHTSNSSELKRKLLARAAVCPGASTLILNLLQSVDAAEYAKRVSWRKLWIQEYIDGMCHQIFPMVFTVRFQYEKFEDVVRNVYERYGAILFAVYDRKAQRRGHSSSGGASPSAHASSNVPIAPFESYVCDGDIGFVIAKTASVVLHIVSTYGHWRETETEATSERLQVSATDLVSVRVASDTLLRRPAQQQQRSFRESARVLDAHSLRRRVGGSSSDNDDESARMDLRARKWHECNSDNDASSVDASRASVAPLALGTNATAPVRVTLHAVDEDSTLTAAPTSHGARVVEAARMHDAELVRAALERDHIRTDTRHMVNHYVVCAGVLADALAFVRSLRLFCEYEHDVQVRARASTVSNSNRTDTPSSLRQAQQLSMRGSRQCFVLLVHTVPDARAIMRVLKDAADDSEHSDAERVLEDVYFVAGSAARASDLVRIGAPRARRVLVLSAHDDDDAQPLGLQPPTESESDDARMSDTASLADFGVISAMLAVEIARQQQQQQQFGNNSNSPVSPRRRRLTSRSFSADSTLPSDALAPTYQREVDQGLPRESVKLRMLERFPNLDATVFHDSSDGIDPARLHDQQHQLPLDAKHSHVGTEYNAIDGPASSADAAAMAAAARLAVGNTLGVLEHAANARFCRPRDRDVCDDTLPFLAPSVASGNVVLVRLLDRIVCQSFYNPYITDLVDALAAGSTTDRPTTGTRTNTTHRHRRLFRVHVADAFVGCKFVDVFVELLRLDRLAIGLLRSPNAAVLENLLPYVYTCPDPETLLHAGDRIFVLG